MNPIRTYAPLVLSLIAGLQAVSLPAQQRARTPRVSHATGANGAVATGSPTAAAAAIKVLRDGGNAADAAVTALLIQSVLESSLFCFGSEVPIIVYDAKRKVVEVVAGQGVAPRLATAEFYNKHRDGVIRGRGDPTTAAVPAFLDTVVTMLDRYGTLTFAAAAAPVLDILEDGRRGWYGNLAKTMRQLIAAEARSPKRSAARVTSRR